jgi:hypothetical protein
LSEVFRASFCFFCFAVGIGGRIRPEYRAESREAVACATAAQPVSDEVAQAEAAIVKSDWKAAEARLDPWLAAHPAMRGRCLTQATWPMRKIGWRPRPGSTGGRGSEPAVV